MVTVDRQEHIHLVETLAREIWPASYVPIIGQAQVDYMLDKFQSQEAIAHQIQQEGYEYYLIFFDEQALGYFAFQERSDALFLSKIYVRADRRGKGYGKSAIRFIEGVGKERGLLRITLTVNKNNVLAVRAYERYGFKNLGSVIQEIGQGFIMDDYQMEKHFERT